ncbi:MAG: AmmeMemoRadiSam system protein B [Armatimonadetes bacterium]|nr:AmmeMemoRadiSam system protein B [Armatimonadota bacterium]MDW8027500.1 AmmeMemoRadiSam system protein B [Armatimonadota bacterium]
MVRKALVAGLFYAGEPKGLERQLKDCFNHRLGPGYIPKPNEQGQRRIIGLVAPHAGYMYSGMTAAKAYAALAEDGIPEVAIIFAPAHYKPGAPFAVWTKGLWETPIGDLTVDEEMANELVKLGKGFKEDFEPHLGWFGRGEHSIEVQLPFLKFVYGDKTPSIVPICVSNYNLSDLKEAGAILGEVILRLQRDAVIIASCDFTHYEPHAVAEVHDREALNRIVNLDSDTLWQTIRRYQSQSDVLVAIPMIEAGKKLGAKRGEIIGYSTSGNVTGDLTEVVGYGAAAIMRD